jgi:multicomponent Na+:H+ antiporter subunit C
VNEWSVEQVLALCAAGLVGLGLYGVIVAPHALRRIVAFNVTGGGVFLFFGAIARRGAAAGFAGDPLPQALIITGIVVAFAATALAVAVLTRWHELRRGADECRLARESNGGCAPVGGRTRSYDRAYGLGVAPEASDKNALEEGGADG